MHEIFVAIVAFALILGLINGPLRSAGVTYVTHRFFFIGAFMCTALLLLAYTGDFPRFFVENSPGAMVMCAAVYIIFGYFWQSRMQHVSASFPVRVPERFRSILTPTGRFCSVKVCEIFFQDVVAVIVVWELLGQDYTFTEVAGVLMLASFVLHLPSVYWHGAFFGGYYLVSSVLLMPLAVWFLMFSHSGFLALYALHITSYMMLYVYMTWYVATRRVG